jgi:hypothetical protein
MQQKVPQVPTIRPTKRDKERIDQLKERFGCPTDIGAVRLALARATESPRYSVAVSEELFKVLQGFQSWEIEIMLREALALRQSQVDWIQSCELPVV